MALSDSNCKHSKSKDKGLSFLCFIHYFLLISVTFLRKTALLCSLMDAEMRPPIQLGSLGFGLCCFVVFFFPLNNRITDSEIEISPPNVCSEITSWCNSSTVPRAFT